MSFRNLRAGCVVLGSLALLAATAVTPAGIWKGVARTPHGAVSLEIVLEQDGGTWAGRGAAGGGLLQAGSDLENLVVAGDSVRFDLSLPTNVGTATMSMRGTVDGDRMRGVFRTETDDGMPMGSGSWEATRAVVKLPGGQAEPEL